MKRRPAAVHDINEARVRRASFGQNKSAMVGFVRDMVRSSLIGIGFLESYADEAAKDMADDWAEDKKRPSWKK